MKVQTYSADDLVEIDGAPMKIRDVPSAFLRAQFGVGHFPGHGRQVVAVPGRTFPFTPETCLVDIQGGEWIDSTTMVCTGCGLDAT